MRNNSKAWKCAIRMTMISLLCTIYSNTCAFSQDNRNDNISPSKMIIDYCELFIKEVSADNISKYKSLFISYQLDCFEFDRAFDEEINRFANALGNKSEFVRYELLTDAKLCDNMYYCAIIFLFRSGPSIYEYYLVKRNMVWAILIANTGNSDEFMMENSRYSVPGKAVSECRKTALLLSEMYKSKEYDKFAEYYVDNMYILNTTRNDVRAGVDKFNQFNKLSGINSFELIGEYNYGDVMKTCLVYFDTNTIPFIMEFSFCKIDNKWKVLKIMLSNKIFKYKRLLLYKGQAAEGGSK